MRCQLAKPGKKESRVIFNGELYAGSLFHRPEESEVPGEAPIGFDPRRPEESYRAATSAEHRRRYGQFFTPEPVAKLMCEWIAACRPERVLDPATGPGIFVREILRQLPDCSVTAIDVDPIALAAARAAVGSRRNVELIRADFLTWNQATRFDAVICNPPYLKHHNFHYGHDVFAEIGRRSGVCLSRLTNIYVLFILEICRRLREGGRAAIIVPGEWVNANYGAALKRFLLENGFLRALIYFAHSSLVFEDSLTTASVLLIDKAKRGNGKAAVLTAYAEGDVEIERLRPVLGGRAPRVAGVVAQHLTRAHLLGSGKWDYALSHEIRQASPGFVPLGKLAETRRGIATGANKYFHLPTSLAKERGIRPICLLSCVGRAADVPSIIFRTKDFERLVLAGARTQLLSLRGKPTASERAYIQEGEALGLPDRYLLAGRNPWYSMEEREPSPIWAAVFGRKGLRCIYNEAGVCNLTAFHCVYPKNADAVFAKALTAVLNSSRVQELAKQHRRVYGGGLAKFEPKDLLDIEVPDLRLVGHSLLSDLAHSLDALDTAITGNTLGQARTMETLDGLVAAAGRAAAEVTESGRSPAT
jgi:adenine-specific DNA-methyltransferase